jgi:AcrR family transcriptional regulator
MRAKSEDDIREDIIQAAEGIFARYGFRKTTMDEIAKAIHKAKTSIYYYFKSKDQIFQAIIEKESQKFKEELAKAINKENTPQEKIRAYVITKMRILHRLVNFYSALKEEYLEHQLLFIETIRKKYEEDEIKMVKELLKGGVEKGVFSVKDLKTTALAIVIGLRGLEYPWAIENEISKTERDINSLLEVLFNGIVKR